jgi:hippurate hydrolase
MAYPKKSTELVHSMGGEIDLHYDKVSYCIHSQERLKENARQKEQHEYAEQKMWKKPELKNRGLKTLVLCPANTALFFIRVGVMNKEKGITVGVHTPTINY